MKKGKLKPQFGVKSIILIVVCALLITADLVTKGLEEAFNWQLRIIPGWIEIWGNIRNPGCAFSFLDNSPYGQPVLITLTVIMLLILIFAFIFVPQRFTVLKVAISIVTAGAVGNLVDRCAFLQVRDFIGLNMLFNGGLVYCNLADFWIVIGAALAVIDLLFLNEWAVFPLTMKAQEAQKKRRQAEKDEEEGITRASEEGSDDDGFNDNFNGEPAPEPIENPDGTSDCVAPDAVPQSSKDGGDINSANGETNDNAGNGTNGNADGSE